MSFFFNKIKPFKMILCLSGRLHRLIRELTDIKHSSDSSMGLKRDSVCGVCTLGFSVICSNVEELISSVITEF